MASASGCPPSPTTEAAAAAAAAKAKAEGAEGAAVAEAAADAAVAAAASGQSSEDRVLAGVERVLDEWLVTGIHRAGARKFIRDKICAEAGQIDCARARQWLLLRMNGRIWDHGQPLMCRTPENVPGVRTLPVWPRGASPWLGAVEARHAELVEELLSARSADGPCGFQPYRDPPGAGTTGRAPADGVGVEGVDSGAWNVLYLFLNHKRFEDNCVRFPKTVKAIEEAFPRQYSHAFISALTPGSHIMKHKGPSNRMLRVWLPLTGLEGFRLRVGEEIVRPKAGEAFMWDHSFEHEAWHEGDETRVVLIVDVWHPDLTDPEVKFLSTLQNCRLRAGRALAERAAEEAEAGESQDATHFDIIERARHLLTDDDWWVVNAERDPTTKPT